MDQLGDDPGRFGGNVPAFAAKAMVVIRQRAQAPAAGSPAQAAVPS
jgi:hypothetical protein